MTSRRVIVFLSSVREGRAADRALKFVQPQLEEAGFHVDVFDPAVMPFPIVKQPLHWYPDQKAAPEWLQKAGKLIREADCFVIISAEYNNGIPPALSNMLDHFAPDWFQQRPTLIITYSPSVLGGARVTVPLLGMLSELKSPVIPTTLMIPEVYKVLDTDGCCSNERTVASCQKAVKHLRWYTDALFNQRQCIMHF